MKRRENEARYALPDLAALGKEGNCDCRARAREEEETLRKDWRLRQAEERQEEKKREVLELYAGPWSLCGA